MKPLHAEAVRRAASGSTAGGSAACRGPRTRGADALVNEALDAAGPPDAFSARGRRVAANLAARDRSLTELSARLEEAAEQLAAASSKPTARSR